MLFRSNGGVIYRAGCEHIPAHKWKPSIHMPKFAARIWLRVTDDSRPERLQDISEEDARREGITEPVPVHGKQCDASQGREGHWSYRQAFFNLWESLHGKGSWEKNPWVWVHSVEVVSTTGREAVR